MADGSSSPVRKASGCSHAGRLILALLLLTATLAGSAHAQNGPPKQPPVAIVSPGAGTEVTAGEVVNLQVLLRRDIQAKATAVQFVCDGRSVGLISSKPYEAGWDTNGLKEGRYVVEAYAYLVSGNKVAAEPVEISVRVPSVTLTEGAPILVATEEQMVSGEIQTGATIHFKVDKDVIAPDGRILIQAGAPAQGEVVKSEGSGFFGQAGALDFTVNSVKAADGTTVSLRANKNASGDDTTGGVIAGAMLVSIFFVFMSGSDVEIPPGTIYTAYVAHDTVIARPLPPRVDAAVLSQARVVTITGPTEGARVQKSDKVPITLTLSPQDDHAYIRLYLDDRLVAAQPGSPATVEWNADEVQLGEHTLQAEATYSVGRVVRSAPVKFTLKDD